MTLVPFHLRPYRPCVGIMLVNARKEIFVAQRIDTPADAWQMPQGGLDEGESVREAALRELREETNCTSVSFIAELDEWLSYDVPQALADRIWHGRFRGQTQKWIALRFLGSDDEINLKAFTPEFSQWRWASKEELPALAISFKRGVYETVVDKLWPRVESCSDKASQSNL